VTAVHCLHQIFPPVRRPVPQQCLSSVVIVTQVYSILPRPYKKNIKSLFVIHAPDSAKAFFRFVLFMVSRKFWKKVHYLPCVASLAAELEAKEDIKSFVPRFVVAHEVRHAPKLQRLAEAYAITKAKADAKKAASAAGGGGGGAKPPGLPAPAPVQPVRCCNFVPLYPVFATLNAFSLSRCLLFAAGRGSVWATAGGFGVEPTRRPTVPHSTGVAAAEACPRSGRAISHSSPTSKLPRLFRGVCRSLS